jgi:hypothetical protein
MSDFKVSIEGLEDVNDALDTFNKKLDDLASEKTIPLSELFTPQFLSKYTSFTSLEDMVQKSGFKVETQEDFESIPEKEWNTFIISHSQFSSWEEMMETGSQEWAQRKLGL